MKTALLLFGLSSIVLGQQTVWGQCGGIGWTGSKTCVSGTCCTYGNDWYYQCLPGNCAGSTTTSATTSSPTTSKIPPSLTTSTTSSASSTTSDTSKTTKTSTKSVSLSSSKTTSLSTTVSKTTTSSAALSTFSNPIIYQDLPDNDVFYGPDGYFYLSASNFHFSPGAPIYRSKDLQHWEAVGHSIPTLDFGDSYSLIGGQAYRRGTWASSMRYRKSNKTWYWIGCVDFYNSYVYTASSPQGPWTRAVGLWARCYYDCGLFIDDDDTMYVVHGSNNVNVTQLAPNGLSEVKTAPMASNPAGYDGMEGNRLYKRNGVYYILNDSGSGQITWIWKSNSLWGPWTMKVLQQYSGGPVPTGGTPHQGSLVETPLGDWYFISFTWTFPLGRIPVIAPVTWGSDGWPVLGLVSGKWNATYPNPLPQFDAPSWTGTDSFTGTSLGPRWEWNHNPDTTKYSVNDGVTLSAATVTNDLYLARNTLTHRPEGPSPLATVVLDTTNLADGDRAGLVALGILSAYIGVVRSGSSYTIVNRQGMTLSTSDWSTTSIGTDVTSAVVSKGKIWLRGSADPLGTKQVSFQYSTDGVTFKSLGSAFTLSSDYSLFMGFRWGIFNHATKSLGGSVKLISYTQV